MTELTPAERERLATEGMGWVKGWARWSNQQGLLKERYWLIEEECRNACLTWGVSPTEVYANAAGVQMRITAWLPDLPGHIEQAFELLDAMHEREWREMIDYCGKIVVPGENAPVETYTVELVRRPSGLCVTASGDTRQLAICRAVLAALEVK